MGAVELAVRALLIVVFATAVVGKVRTPEAFLDYQDSMVALARPIRLEGAVATAVAAFMVVCEAAVVLLLMAPITRPVGYALAAALLAGFAAAVLGALRQGSSVRCRCFGSAGSVLGRAHAIRNVMLAAGAVAGMAGGPPVAASAALVALTCGALLGLVVTRWEDLRFLTFGGDLL